MKLSTEVKGQTAVISINGDLDAATAPEATGYLKSALEEEWTTIVIDLGEVPFMSSAGLRFILNAHQQGKTAGIQIVLAAPRAGVEKVLSTSGFTRIVTTFDTVDEAVGKNQG